MHNLEFFFLLASCLTHLTIPVVFLVFFPFFPLAPVPLSIRDLNEWDDALSSSTSLTLTHIRTYSSSSWRIIFYIRNTSIFLKPGFAGWGVIVEAQRETLYINFNHFHEETGSWWEVVTDWPFLPLLSETQSTMKKQKNNGNRFLLELVMTIVAPVSGYVSFLPTFRFNVIVMITPVTSRIFAVTQCYQFNYLYSLSTLIIPFNVFSYFILILTYFSTSKFQSF